MKKKINATVNAMAILWAFCLISWLIFLFRMTNTAILKTNNCAPIPMPVKTLILSKSVNRKLRLKSGIMQHRIPIIPKIKERCNNLFSSLSIQLMGEGLGFVDLIKLKIRDLKGRGLRSWMSGVASTKFKVHSQGNDVVME